MTQSRPPQQLARRPAAAPLGREAPDESCDASTLRLATQPHARRTSRVVLAPESRSEPGDLTPIDPRFTAIAAFGTGAGAQQVAASGAQPRSLLVKLARLGLGLAILVATLIAVDPYALALRLAKLDGSYMALGALIALPQLCLCALRWRFTAQRLGVPLRFRDALGEYGLSLFLNVALPLGVLGDALRVMRHRARLDRSELSPRHSRLTAALHAALVERGAGQLVVCLWALAAAPLWIDAVGGPASGRTARMLLAGAAALALAGVAFLLARRVMRRLGRAALDGNTASRSAARAESGSGARSTGRLPVRVRQFWELARDFQRGLFSPPALLAQFVFSSGVVVTLIGQLYCALAALGLVLPPLTAAKTFPFVLLSMAIPFSFAGFGPREAATAALYHALHLSAVDGTAFALVYGSLSLLAALPGLLLFLLGRR